MAGEDEGELYERAAASLEAELSEVEAWEAVPVEGVVDWPAASPGDPYAPAPGSPADHPTVVAARLAREDFVKRFPMAALEIETVDLEQVGDNNPARGGRHGDDHPAAIAQAQRDYEALQLRAKGFDYRSIALLLGLVGKTGKPQVSSVHKMVKRAMARGAKAHGVDEARQIELVRLDKLTERLMSALDLAPANRVGGIVDRIVLTMDRRAKLLGLDAPTQVQTNATMNVHGRVEIDGKVEVEVAVAVTEYLQLLDEVVGEETDGKLKAIEAESREVDEEDLAELGQLGELTEGVA